MGCAPSSQVCDSKMADFSISSNSATRSSSIAAHSTVIEKSNYNNRNIEIPTYNVASLFDENPERLASPKSNERVENEIEEEVFSTNSTISVFSTKQTTKFPSSYLKDNHSERSVIPETMERITFGPIRIQDKAIAVNSLLQLSMRCDAEGDNYSVIVAVCKRIKRFSEEQNIVPLLKTGYSRRFFESCNVLACLDDLQQLVYGEIRNQRKLRACAALVTALNNVSEAVEITDNEHSIQYVNFMHERITGFTLEELAGKDSQEHSHNELMKNDVVQANGKHGKVMNLINAVQESSSLTVSQALEKVVEILRTSELYAPRLPQQIARDSDPMTNDLVEGLVVQTKRPSISGYDFQSHRASLHHVPHTNPVAHGSLSQVSQSVKSILEKESTWYFDVIQLEEATNKKPLVYLGLKTFARFGVCQFLSIEESVLFCWLQLIEANYHIKNPYHNSTHAADVLHASAFFLECSRTKYVLDTADCVSSLIAAAVHDLDHPAKTNAFLVNESNQLAILYNDLDEYRSLRQSIVDMVLATEMKQHFEHLHKFTQSINKAVLRCDSDSVLQEEVDADNGTIFTQLSTVENRSLIKRMLIKCADVSNPLRPWKLCVKWAERIAEEYCSQTDEEIKLGLPVVMPVFDRKTCSIPKSQMSFIDVFINSMFDAWDFYCDIPDLMNNLQSNYVTWKEMEETAKGNKIRAASQGNLSSASPTSTPANSSNRP